MCLVLKTALAAATFSILSWANPVRAADGPKPLFAGDEVLSLTLTGPLDDDLARQRRQAGLRRAEG